MRKSAIILISISLLGSCIGFFREILVAKYYGIGIEIENFVIASTVAIIIIPRINKAITSSFIPIYIKEKKEKSRNYNYIIKQVFYLSKLSSVLFAFVFICLIFYSLFYNNNQLLDIGIHSLIFVPAIYYFLKSSIYNSFHNVSKSFVIPSISNFLLNIFFIAFLYISINLDSLYFLSLGIVIYSYIQNFILKKTSRIDIESIETNLILKKKELNSFYIMLLPAFLSAVAPIIPIFIMRYTSSFYDDGDIVAFNYANLITGLFPMLFTVSILTILTPRFSEWYLNNLDIKNKMNLVMLFVSASILPLQLFLYRFADEIIRLFFLQGKFDANAAHQTSMILGILSFGIVIRIFREILIRYSLSVNKSKQALSNTGIYIILSIISSLIASYFWGIKGITISIVCVEMYNLISFLIKLNLELNVSYFFKYFLIQFIAFISVLTFIKTLDIYLSILIIACYLIFTLTTCLDITKKNYRGKNDYTRNQKKHIN